MIWRRVATKLTRDAVWQKLSSVSLVGSGRSNSRETVDILLDRGRTAKVVSERLGHHFTATIPDLDESVLFVEIEGPNVGCWLSTYGLDESIREDLQRALDAQVASLIE